MSSVILSAHGVSKHYRVGAKEVRALDKVSIDISRGASIAVIGPSGAGKSTLLHLLGGLDAPTSGKVLIDGTDIYRMADRDRALLRNSRIGFVFQFYHLLPEFTAIENVMLPMMIRGRVAGRRAAAARERAKEALRMVGLERRGHHRPGELSGGESQRVAIARSLVNSPQILLCDEPTGNLDSKTSAAILDLLFEIKARSDMALVIVTHDQNISQKTRDVISLKDGHLE